MTLSSKHWTLVSVVSAALLLDLAIFGGSYRALGVLFLLVGLWLRFKREPEQMEIRPAVRVIGWIFVCLAAVAIVASALAIASHKIVMTTPWPNSEGHYSEPLPRWAVEWFG
jgi:hypothetical protein